MRWLRTVPWWQWLLAAGVLIGLAGGGYVGNKMANAEYTSSSQVLVTGQANAEQLDGAYASNQYANQRMTTYAQIVSSAQVTGPAAQVLGTDAATLGSKITATVEGDTTVLTLNVKGADPDLARRAATAVTQSFVNAITKLETVPGGAVRVTLNVITDPAAPATRSLPPLWLWIIGGAVGGGVLAFLAALLLRWLYPSKFSFTRRKPRTAEQTQRMMPIAKTS